MVCRRQLLGDFIRGITAIALPAASEYSLVDYEVNISSADWALWKAKVPIVEVDTHKVWIYNIMKNLSMVFYPLRGHMYIAHVLLNHLLFRWEPRTWLCPRLTLSDMRIFCILVWRIICRWSCVVPQGQVCFCHPRSAFYYAIKIKTIFLFEPGR